MTQDQQSQMERDLLIPRLSYAVIDIRVNLQNPTAKELETLEIERDALSHYLDKFKTLEAAE